MHQQIKITMKAILINPEDRSVTYVELDKGLDPIYKILDCDCFACPIVYGNNDAMYCDDEGLFKPQKGGIIMPDWEYPILGKIIIVGTDEDGNSIDVKSELNYFTDSITWLNEAQAEYYRERYN